MSDHDDNIRENARRMLESAGDREDPDAGMGEHLTSDGRFQSDRYPTVPAGKAPLSDRDPQALVPLVHYALLHAATDKHGDAAMPHELIEALIAQHGHGAVADAFSVLEPHVRNRVGHELIEKVGLKLKMPLSVHLPPRAGDLELRVRENTEQPRRYWRRHH